MLLDYPHEIPDFVDWTDPVNPDDPLNTGLVSWWLGVEGGGYGGGKWLDLCQRNNGTLTNGPSWQGPRGRPGGWGSLGFDGSNDVVRVADHSSLRVTTGLTLALWIRPISTAVRGPLVEKWGASDAYGLRYGSDNTNLNNNNSKFSFTIDEDGTEGGATSLGSSGTAPLNTWTHIAAVFNGTSLATYINGAPDNSSSFASKTIFAGTSPLRIGSTANDAETEVLWYNGSLDDLRIYRDRALSATEVLALVQASSAHYPTQLNRIRRYVRVSPSGDGLLRRMQLEGLFTGGGGAL